MASYPVTVYRWDDPGAPQLDNGKISSFFNILHKCLVEGYGDKVPLGWTRSFYDPTNFKAAWRNNVAAGGSGGSAYFYSNTNTDVNNTVIRLTSCKSISELGVVTGQGRLTAARFDMATNTGKWVLIGTSIGFYFYSFGSNINANGNGLVNNSENRPSFYAGDIFSVIPTDAGKFVMFHEITSAGDNSNPQSLRNLNNINNTAYSSGAAITLWDADNFNSFQTYGYASVAMQSPGSGNIIAANAHPLIFHNVSIASTASFNFPNQSSPTDRLGIPIRDSLIRPALRGVLPGLLVTYSNFGHGEILPLVKLQAGVNYHGIPNPNSAGSCSALIQASGDWYDPFN